MKEQDINFTENAFAHNTGIKSRQCDPSKTSFFHLDKNYCPREYDKVNKVLRPSQTGNISVGMNETRYQLCAGQETRSKAAIHAMENIFEEEIEQKCIST